MISRSRNLAARMCARVQQSRRDGWQNVPRVHEYVNQVGRVPLRNRQILLDESIGENSL